MYPVPKWLLFQPSADFPPHEGHPSYRPAVMLAATSKGLGLMAVLGLGPNALDFLVTTRFVDEFLKFPMLRVGMDDTLTHIFHNLPTSCRPFGRVLLNEVPTKLHCFQIETLSRGCVGIIGESPKHCSHEGGSGKFSRVCVCVWYICISVTLCTYYYTLPFRVFLHIYIYIIYICE